MAKKTKQPGNQQQSRSPGLPNADAEKARPAAQSQDSEKNEEASRGASPAHDNSQDADRHSGTRHVQSGK
jgi:hypothetical protein